MRETVCFSTALSDLPTLYRLLTSAVWLVICHPADVLFFSPVESISCNIHIRGFLLLNCILLKNNDALVM